jgi:hypothetical protein
MPKYGPKLNSFFFLLKIEMDIFQVLSRGTRYDQKKFPRNHELFGSKKAASLEEEEATNSETLAVPDFFSPPTAQKTASSTKKNDTPSPDSTVLDSAPAVLLDTPERVKQFQSQNKIRVFGSDVVSPVSSFNDLFEKYYLSFNR